VYLLYALNKKHPYPSNARIVWISVSVCNKCVANEWRIDPHGDAF
jgi:hypothetical protein